jgi:hypothetical protein
MLAGVEIFRLWQGGGKTDFLAGLWIPKTPSFQVYFGSFFSLSLAAFSNILFFSRSPKPA